MIAAIREHGEYIARGEVLAPNRRSGIGEAFELRSGDRVEVNHAHVGKFGVAPGVQSTNCGRDMYVPEDVRAAGDHGPQVEVKQPASRDDARTL